MARATVGELAAALANGSGGPGHIENARRIVAAVEGMEQHLAAMDAHDGHVEMIDFYRDARSRVVECARDLVAELGDPPF